MGDFRRDVSNPSLEQWLEAHRSEAYRSDAHRTLTRVDSEDKFRAAIARLSSENNLPQLAPALGELPEPSSLRIGGMPRVESLEFLAAMFKGQTQNRNAYVKEEPGYQANGTEAREPFSLPPPFRAPASVSRPMTHNMIPQPSQSASDGQTTTDPDSSVPPNGRAAARGRQSKDNVEQSLSKLMKESKAETRKARRMLSNRESARRSRRRKQEHLGKLESQISDLQRERDNLLGVNTTLATQLKEANQAIVDLQRQLARSDTLQ